MTNQTDRIYDELLLTLVRSGDRRAGERLAARWHPRLMRTARRLLRDDDLARDAVQEAWAGICRGWLSLNDPRKYPAWAFSILHRKCADQIRSQSARRSRHGEMNGEAVPAPADGAEDRIAIDQALGTLGLEHRAAAILFFGEGLTLAEIATVTGVPVGTAKSRIFHARQQLMAALKGDEE